MCTIERLNKAYNLERCSECGKYFPPYEITNFWDGKVCEDCCGKYIEKWYSEYIDEFVNCHIYNFIFGYYYNTLNLNDVYKLYKHKFDSLSDEEKKRHYNNFCNNNKKYLPFLIRRLKDEE